MVTTWRTVRVFISSTFRDMHAERDHLVRFVFPRLREELLKRCIHLVDVDLRWGVTSEQDALQVCREIIDECRPRFLCILGGRYGWIPTRKEHSITEDEIRYAVLDRSKTNDYSYFYFRDPAATEAMVEKEPGEFRELSGSKNEHRLKALKQAIKDAGFNPYVYPAKWDYQQHRLIGLDEFGARVYADLMASIDAEFGTFPLEVLNEFAEENAVMEAFVEQRIQHYVTGTRQPIFDVLRSHAEGIKDNGYFCLVGEPGSGKSALLGKFYRDYVGIADGYVHADHLVIPHFVGASASSTDIRKVLRRLCYELAKGAGITQDIPDEYEKLCEIFQHFLAKAAMARHIVILIDAIDQLDTFYQTSTMRWLPNDLPDNVRIILSARPCLALEALRKRQRPPIEMQLSGLSSSDAEMIVDGFLHRYGKTLEPEQRRELLSKNDARTPLYLLVALEELRTLGKYKIAYRIHDLPGQVQPMFKWILKRLEDDPGFRDRDGHAIGVELVHSFVSLLGISRHGLSQRELAELIVPGNPQPTPPILPDSLGNIAALIRLLRPYLMQRGELLDFYHGQFREAVSTECLNSEEKEKVSRLDLIKYFQKQELTPRKADELLWQLAKAKEWKWLGDTLVDIPLVELAYQRNGNEVLEYWSAIVKELQCNIGEVYSRRWRDALDGGQELWGISTILGNMGYPEESERIVAAMVEKFRRKDEKRQSLARVLSGYAQFYMARHDLTKAEELLEECAGICRQLDNEWNLASCLGDLAGVVVNYDDRKAMSLLKEAEAIFRRRSGSGLASCLGNQANIHLMHNRVYEAMELEREAIKICEEWGVPTSAAEHRVGLAQCLNRIGEWQEALELLESAEREYRRFSAHGGLGSCLGIKANILAEHNSLEEAFEVGEEAESLLRRSGQLIWLSNCLYNRALLCLRLGKNAVGVEKAREALDLMNQIDAPFDFRNACAQLLAQFRM